MTHFIPRLLRTTSTTSLLGLFLLASCQGSDDGDAVPPKPPLNGAGGSGHGVGGASGAGTGQDSAGAADGDTGGAGAGARGGSVGELGEAHPLTSAQASMVGVTSDGWAIFRDGDVLNAAQLEAKASAKTSAESVSDSAGSVLIKGRVVFNWANVDWTKNVGDLSIWTHAGGAQTIGPTTYSEALVSASEDGSFLVYTANTNTKKGTLDLMIASSDLSTNDVLIKGVGLGGDTTCSASLGFVGNRLLVGYCVAGSRDARIERFELGDDGWASTLIAEDALPTWSADAAGDRVFFQSNNYEGFYSDGDNAYRIDASVSRGFLMPDGSAVLYTVGDQLRRSPVPEADPIPIVTTGYSEPVAFSSNYGQTLYSSKVSYENGTQRDLRLVATDGFNPEPIELVADPVATLGRSSMTTDGKFVLFLTDMTPLGGTLHVVRVDGQERLTLPNVLDVLAGAGSAIVYSDNSSDPDVYPTVADLNYLELDTDDDPRLIEGSILDAKNFQVDADGSHVVYSRSGVDRDSEDPARNGLYWVALP